MNKIFILILTMTFALGGKAQADKNPFPKTITVTGSAETEIVPDEIYVQVDLKEYQKKGQDKVSIDKIKDDFLKKVKSLGLPDSAISIAAYDGSNGNPWIRKKNKKEELFASISYQVKLKSSQQMDQLVNLLDDNATENFSIIRTSHSRLAEIRKQLKIEAVKAAKEKAKYLAQAIDEQAGEAITINEPGEYIIPYYTNMMKSNTMMRDQVADGQDEAAVDFRKIKYRYDVTVVFALK
jgi:uncharacterized protein YggE